MINNKKVLAIIPARGGSKGLPGKNIKELMGKPLIAWPIETALQASYVDRVIVTTDDHEIADISRSYGADVPFLRPSEFACDTSPSSDAILHTIDYCEVKDKDTFDLFVLLEPTSPLTEPKDVDNALEKLTATEKKSVVGIGNVEDMHPEFCVEIQNDGRLLPFQKKSFGLAKRRQDLDDLYFFDGSLYASDVEFYKERKTFYHEQTLGYQFPRWKNTEIDELIDFLYIETILKNKQLFESDG